MMNQFDITCTKKECAKKMLNWTKWTNVGWIKWFGRDRNATQQHACSHIYVCNPQTNTNLNRQLGALI